MTLLGGTLALVEHSDGFEDGVAYDFQALWTELVHGVLRGVMEDVVVAVVEVDDIGGWDAAFHKRQMVVFHRSLKGVEVRLVALALRGGVDEVEQPWSRVEIALDVEVGGADRVYNSL